MMYHLTGCLQHHMLFKVWPLGFRISEAISIWRHSFSTTCPKTADLLLFGFINARNSASSAECVTGKLTIAVDTTDQ